MLTTLGYFDLVIAFWMQLSLRVNSEYFEKLQDKSFLAQHPELQDDEHPLCTDSVVLLIDEYDAPLAENLDNSAVFNEIKKEYKALFSTIKSMSNFRFVFLTGITSYAQLNLSLCQSVY